METAGDRLKRTRERLRLRYRDVEEASQRIAERLGNPEYSIALSRLADIENKGTLPSLFRLYSLASIYRLEMRELIGWYGIPSGWQVTDPAAPGIAATHLTGWRAPDEGQEDTDPGRSGFLPRLHRWGATAAGLLSGFDARRHRFGYIGLEDRSMQPILTPGSLVLIDVNRRKIAAGGWMNESERPIYFVEHREGYACGWCSASGNGIILQPHPASSIAPVFFRAGDVEIVGQVIGSAMLLEAREWRDVQATTRAR